MLTILTYNAALQDVRLLKQSVYCPVKYVRERFDILPSILLQINADIIFLQELFHRDLQQDLYKRMEKTYPYVTGFAHSGLKLRLGNELLTLSRYPLSHGKLIRFQAAVAEEKLFTSKGFYHTVLSVLNVGQVDLINFHTTAGGVNAHPEDDRMDNIRSQQIDQILNFVNSLKLVILAGDLNAGPHTSIANYRQVLDAGFFDMSARAKDLAITWDPENPLVKHGKEHQLPAQRIDHIFINAQLAEIVNPIETKIVLDDHHVPTAIGEIPLSDHYGLLVALQSASKL